MGIEKPIGIDPVIEPIEPKKKRVLTHQEIEERLKAFAKKMENIELMAPDVDEYTGEITIKAIVNKAEREVKLQQIAAGTFKPRPRPKPLPIEPVKPIGGIK
jgi:hypothetical protein